MRCEDGKNTGGVRTATKVKGDVRERCAVKGGLNSMFTRVPGSKVGAEDQKMRERLGLNVHEGPSRRVGDEHGYESRSRLDFGHEQSRRSDTYCILLRGVSDKIGHLTHVKTATILLGVFVPHSACAARQRVSQTSEYYQRLMSALRLSGLTGSPTLTFPA